MKNKFLNRITHALKSLSLALHIIFYLFGIAAPMYAIKAGNGFLPLHISLICISTVSLVIYIIANRSDDKEKIENLKAKRKRVKKLRKYAKRLTRLYMIMTTAYAVYFTATGFNFLSALLLIVMIIAFIFDLLISAFAAKVKKTVNNLKNPKPEDIIIYSTSEE